MEADNSPSLLDALKFGWPLLLLYLRWLHTEIDKLKDQIDDAVKRDEHNGTIAQIRREIHDNDQALSGRLDLFLVPKRPR